MFTRFFNDTQPTIIYEQIPISKYLPQEIRRILAKIGLVRFGGIPADHLIVCPLYTNKSGCISDYQIGVTGKAKINETNLKIAMWRELGEEIGIVPKTFADLQVIDQSTSKKTRMYGCYSLNLKDSTILPITAKFYSNPAPDQTNYRIGCIVHGNIENVQKFFNQPTIPRFANNDDIVGIVAIPIKSIDHLIKRNGKI